MIDVINYMDGFNWLVFTGILIFVWWAGCIMGYYSACRDFLEGKIK